MRGKDELVQKYGFKVCTEHANIIYARFDGLADCPVCDEHDGWSYDYKALEDKLSDAEYEIDEWKTKAEELESQVEEVEGLLDDLRRAIGG